MCFLRRAHSSIIFNSILLYNLGYFHSLFIFEKEEGRKNKIRHLTAKLLLRCVIMILLIKLFMYVHSLACLLFIYNERDTNIVGFHGMRHSSQYAQHTLVHSMVEIYQHKIYIYSYRYNTAFF